VKLGLKEFYERDVRPFLALPAPELLLKSILVLVALAMLLSAPRFIRHLTECLRDPTCNISLRSD